MQFNFFEIATSNEVIAAVLTAIFACVFRALQARAKVTYGHGNYFTYCVPQNQPPNTVVLYKVGTIFLKNAGRATAQNVELTFNFKPEHFQIWPPISFTEQSTLDGRFVLNIPFLARKENFTVNLLMATTASGLELPELLHVRSKDGPGKKQIVAPMVVLSRTVIGILWALILLGLFQTSVFLVSVVKHLFNYI